MTLKQILAGAAWLRRPDRVRGVGCLRGEDGGDAVSENTETATDALVRVLAQLAERERREAELFAQMRRDLAEARAPIAAFLEKRNG